ncbi:MAG: DUF3137 domain-containing protein [Pseudomonadota bacterium]|nr:DUF3137 domain-containing protein [Pseudomonadota bacterium]MEC8665506.1 DUF3137 domain-containing protein [Pseudomonadota bacterium]
MDANIKQEIWDLAVDVVMNMSDEIDELERKRKGHVWGWLFFSILSCSIVVPVLYLLVTVRVQDVPPLIYVVLFFIGALLFWWNYSVADKDYRRRTKQKFMFALARTLKMKYSPTGLFKIGQVYDHHILERYARSHEEDGLSFVYLDRDVHLQEYATEKTTPSSPSILEGVIDVLTDTMWSHSIWQGLSSSMSHSGGSWNIPNARHTAGKRRNLLLRIETRKQHPHHTLLVPRRWLRRGTYWLRPEFRRTPFNNFKLMRKYMLVSTDDVQTHDIFNPAFTEVFFEFEKALDARSMSMSIKGGEVVVSAEHCKNLFELSHLLSPISAKSIARVISELVLCRMMIDELKLSPYVGL